MSEWKWPPEAAARGSKRIDHIMNARPLNIAVIGAGNRARKYARYILEHPAEAVLVAAADPDRRRRERFAAETSLGVDRLHESDEEMLAAHGAGIDAVIIASPDRHHYTQAIRALEAGCHILVEKPVACSAEEVEHISREASRRKLVAGVCHVLRYHPYFEALREIISSGSLGRPVAIRHHVSVGLDRALHTFIRGPWADSRLTSPPILSKCCHDADLLLWLTGATSARSIGSVASSHELLRTDMPPGAAGRCIDCPIERDCPFSAVDLYERRRLWTDNFDSLPEENMSDTVARHLRDSRYGRCAYICHTDAPISQTITFTTDTRCSATLTMDMLGRSGRRTTDILLTRGEIHGDELTLTCKGFCSAESVVRFNPGPYHSGADHALVADFIEAVRNPSHTMRAAINGTAESTRICLAAHDATTHTEPDH